MIQYRTYNIGLPTFVWDCFDRYYQTIKDELPDVTHPRYRIEGQSILIASMVQHVVCDLLGKDYKWLFAKTVAMRGVQGKGRAAKVKQIIDSCIDQQKNTEEDIARCHQSTK